MIATPKQIDGKSLLQSLALGTVANLLALTSIIGVIYAGFMVVAVCYDLIDMLARAQAAGAVVSEQSFPRLLWTSLITTGQNGWKGIVGARFIYLAFAFLGLFAAAGWFFGGYAPGSRRWWFSFAGMTAVVALTGVAWAVLQRDQILLWIADSPELYRWRGVLQRSLLTDVSVIAVFSVLISIPIWMSWRWWFEQIALREKKRARPVAADLPSALAEYRSGRPQSPDPASAAGRRDDPYAHLLLSRSFLVPALTLFALLIVAIGIINSQYKASTLRLTHEAFVLSSENPAHEVALSIAPDARKIRIVNINGQGTVSIALRGDDAAAEIAQVPDWSFQRRSRQEYYYQEISLAKVAAGPYRLSFQQAEGWGWYEYLLSQGSTQDSTTLSIILGIVLAGAVLLGGLLLTSVLLALRNR